MRTIAKQETAWSGDNENSGNELDQNSGRDVNSARSNNQAKNTLQREIEKIADTSVPARRTSVQKPREKHNIALRVIHQTSPVSVAGIRTVTNSEQKHASLFK